MKKLLLSLSVLGIFFAYGLHEKHEASEAKVIPPTPKKEPQVQAEQVPSPTIQQASSGYKDGKYTGSVEDVFYGNLQVQATISGGKLTDVEFLQYPNDRDTSIEINKTALVYLRQEAIQAQNANVDIVSAATDSSKGFRRSLES